MKCFIVFFMSFIHPAFAQIQKTVIDTGEIKIDTVSSPYKNLETKIFYEVLWEIRGRDKEYFINNHSVDKTTFNKYHSTWKDMKNCKPCILKVYNEADELVCKGIFYTDCVVGYYIEYYPSGKVRTIGHYKENTTGTWKKLYERGYCRKSGTWMNFNENGVIISEEHFTE